METANPKTALDTHTKKKKQPKHNNVHQTKRAENERGREEKRPTKTNPKQLRKWQQAYT